MTRRIVAIILSVLAGVLAVVAVALVPVFFFVPVTLTPDDQPPGTEIRCDASGSAYFRAVAVGESGEKELEYVADCTDAERRRWVWAGVSGFAAFILAWFANIAWRGRLGGPRKADD